MRVMILVAILVSAIAVKSQSALTGGFMNYLHPLAFTGAQHYIKGTPDTKWSLTSYSGISTGISFFNGGNATYIAAPLGLQLNRRLNENLYAFAGVSATPAYVNLYQAFTSPGINKSYGANGLYNLNNFSTYARAELGLMYVNEAKTFSVSGSIGVERRSYQMLPYQQANRYNGAAPVHQKY